MGRIIEAKAVISAEDRTGKVFDQIARKFKEVGKGAKVSAEIAKMNRSLKGAQDTLKGIDKYRADRGGFYEARKQMLATRAAAVEAAAALARTAKPTREQEQGLRRMERAAEDATRAFERQRSVVLSSRHALTQSGVSIGNLIRDHDRLGKVVDRTSAAIKRQHALAKAEGGLAAGMGETGRREHARIARDRYLVDGMGAAGRSARERAETERRTRAEERAARWADRREAATVLGAGGAVIAGHHGKQIARDAITSAADFDLAVRKQRVFTDLSASDQAGLLAQAKQIGQETQFSNIDVVKAQTAAMQGLPAGFSSTLKAEVAQGIIANVRNFSTLMETDLKEGSEIIRGYLQQTGKDISTKEKALFEANKATNQLVKMAKLGGMSGEDVSQFLKFAASPGTAAGLSPETMMSLAALARRGGLRGDEAGTFIRATSAKLVSPTGPGLAALNAAGIKFSDYVSMPERLSTSALEGQFQMKLGKGFTPSVRKRLDAINADQSLIGDRGKYTEAVVSAVGDILGKTKGGKVRASDTQKAAKAIGDFHKVSAQSVDTERLLNDAMSKDMTLAQLNAWLTDKHGGKGAITQRQWDEFKAARQQIGSAADDPDWAKKKADEVFAGLGGAVENLKGSFENLVLTIGNANAGLIKWAADRMGAGLDSFSKLPEGAQQGLSLGAGAALTGASAWGTLALMKRLLGLGGAVGGAATGGAAAASGAGAAAASGAAGAGAAGVAGRAGMALPALAGAGVALPLIGTAAIGGALIYGSDHSKALAHGGRPTGTMNPSDVLPGLSGAEGASAPGRSKILDWWRSSMPTWAGGGPSSPIPVEVKALPSGADASGQTSALTNTLDKAASASATAANGGQPIEATVKPDQITARVTEAVPVTGEASVAVESKLNVSVSLNEPMLQAKIESAAGRAVAKIPLSSSGSRPGAVSMPGAAAAPGAAK